MTAAGKNSSELMSEKNNDNYAANAVTTLRALHIIIIIIYYVIYIRQFMTDKRSDSTYIICIYYFVAVFVSARINRCGLYYIH